MQMIKKEILSRKMFTWRNARNNLTRVAGVLLVCGGAFAFRSSQEALVDTLPIKVLEVPKSLGVLRPDSKQMHIVTVRIVNVTLQPVSIVVPSINVCSISGDGVKIIDPLTSVEVQYPVHLQTTSPGHHLGDLDIWGYKNLKQFQFHAQLPYQVN